MNVAGSRSNGSVPAIGSKAFKGRADGIGDTRGDLGIDGHAGDIGDAL